MYVCVCVFILWAYPLHIGLYHRISVDPEMQMFIRDWSVFFKWMFHNIVHNPLLMQPAEWCNKHPGYIEFHISILRSGITESKGMP